MDIVVHGTKGGRQIFTPKKLGGLLDVNSDTSKASAIGQEAYAIRFVEKTIIFSKYKIIRDVRGDKRTGFLAFSLFLPNNKKLKGTDILSVLNKVSGEYCRIYIPDNDNNLKDVREDWAFLDRISEEYKTMLRPVSSEDIENLLSGTKDDAFIYYENDELQKYFDAPYQDEYRQYRQVLFVKKELKDKPEDPLNALRHSEIPSDNLTGRIDLDKRVYSLRDYDGQAKNGISIEIRVRGKLLYKKEKTNNKDLISIRYFRKYSKELVVKEGRLNDEWIRKYLIVDEENRKIDVEKNIILDPLIKTIIFDGKDWNGVSVIGVQITCKNAAGDEKLIKSSNQVEFKGEEIGKRWTVSASKGRLFAENKPIDFEKDCPGETSIVSIKLNKHKLEIIAHEETLGSDPIKGKLKISKEEFIGSEIEKPNRITVSCTGYKPFTFDYCPEDHKEPYHIALQKDDTFKTKPGRMFTASPGKHGTWTDGSLGDIDTLWSGGSDLVDKIKPHKRYKFVKFEPSGDMLIAKYEKKGSKFENSNVIALAIILAIVIGFGFWALFTLSRKEPPEIPHVITELDIKKYIDGIDFKTPTIDSFKNQWNVQKPVIENDSTNYKVWEQVSVSIESAILKRKYINDFDFIKLKALSYSKEQQIFKIAIEKIDSSRYDDIKNKLANVSSMSLNQIAESINDVLNHPKPAAEITPEIKKQQEEIQSQKEEKERQRKKIEEQKKEDEKEKKILEQQQKKQEKAKEQDSPPTSTDNPNNIPQKLQTGTVTRDELKSWMTAGMDKYKKSIDLYLDFWASIKGGMQMEDSRQLLKKINDDKYLKKSELQSFLKSVCASSESFKKYSETRGKTACKTLNELRSKVK